MVAMQSVIRRSVATLMAACMLAVSLPPRVQAGEVSPGVDRQRVERLVVEALVHYGVNPAQARARAAALTDEEAARVAAEIDKLPAGGSGGYDVIGGLVLVAMLAVGLIVLLVAIPIVILKKIAKDQPAPSSAGDDAGGGSIQSPDPIY